MRKEFNLGYCVFKENANIDELMELIYQSNLIEDIMDYWIGTVSEGEEFHVSHTITGHIDALLNIKEKYHQDIAQEHIKQVHYTLMENLMNTPGKYRTSGHSFLQSNGDFVVGNPLPEHIPTLMNLWAEKTMEAKSFEEIIKLHYEYETIHPFSDGNGRSGRLLLNWLTLQKLNEYTVITFKHRQEYYKQIHTYRDEFMKANPKIKFTTYNMLPEDTKNYLKKIKENYYTSLVGIISTNNKVGKN